jgi:hypothetical protein
MFALRVVGVWNVVFVLVVSLCNLGVRVNVVCVLVVSPCDLFVRVNVVCVLIVSPCDLFVRVIVGPVLSVEGACVTRWIVVVLIAMFRDGGIPLNRPDVVLVQWIGWR